jgi:predicted CopG family antitoxin
MATKTISIDLEAYERLRRARRARTESFSMVIKRAVWPTPPRTAGAMLKSLEGASVLGEDVLERLEEAHTADRPPEDPWRER